MSVEAFADSNRYHGYISPLLSWEKGVARLSQLMPLSYTGKSGWQDLASYWKAHPDFQESWPLINDLHEQACNIYITRALAPLESRPRMDLVNDFINTLDSIPSSSPGAHVLPWTIFMAAAECSEPVQQRYFERFLLEFHKRNGFANIVMAIGCLREIWSRPRSKSWTNILPGLAVFII